MYDAKKKEDKLMEVKNFLGKGVMKCLNVLALLLVMQTANSACNVSTFLPLILLKS